MSPAAVDLVVLSDYLVADPRMVRDLHSRGVPHLPVRVRDGTGLVGPLVIPGVTSCLGNHQVELPGCSLRLPTSCTDDQLADAGHNFRGYVELVDATWSEHPEAR